MYNYFPLHNYKVETLSILLTQKTYFILILLTLSFSCLFFLSSLDIFLSLLSLLYYFFTIFTCDSVLFISLIYNLLSVFLLAVSICSPLYHKLSLLYFSFLQCQEVKNPITRDESCPLPTLSHISCRQRQECVCVCGGGGIVCVWAYIPWA